MRPSLSALLATLLLVPLSGAEDGEEWISIPKSFLKHLEIPLLQDDLAPSSELHRLLMLSDQEAAGFQQALLATRREFLELVVARCEIEQAEPDHLKIEIPLLGADAADVVARCEAAVTAVLGRSRAELLELVRHDRWSDSLADALYGEAYDNGFDRVVVIEFEVQEDGNWRRSYQTERANGRGGGQHTATGPDLDDYERRLAEAVLARARDEGAAAPDADLEPAGSGDAPAPARRRVARP